MKFIISINGKTFKIKSFKTKDELELLEYLYVHTDLTDDEIDLCINDFLELNGIPKSQISELTDNEKLILLLKIREVTIGDEIKLKYTCPHCNKPLDGKFSIEGVFKPSKSTCLGLFDSKKINIDIHDILTEDEIDNLDLDEFENLKNNIHDYVDEYNFNISSNCIYCKHKNYLTLDKNNIIAFMSEENFMSLSKIIHSLVYFENISRHDVLEMTPLQRIVEISNLEQTKKEIQKLKKESQKR